MCVLDQLVGFGNPDRLAATAQPVVEDDAGRLTPLARAGAIAEHETPAEAHRACRILGRRADIVVGRVDGPGSRQIVGMGLARIDHRLELSIGQALMDVDGQHWPIGRAGRRNRGHGGGLHQLGRMRLRAGNPQGLQSIFLVDGVRQPRPVRRRPVERLVGQLHAFRIAGRSCNSPHRSRAGEITTHGLRRGSRGGNGNLRQCGWQAGRHLRLDPVQQRRDVRGHARRGREERRIFGGQLVDDGQPRVDAGAVRGIDRAVDCRGELHPPTFLQPSKRIAPGRRVRTEVRARDRDQPAAGGKPVERRGDMPISRIGHAPGDIGHDRERRIHQDHGRDGVRREVIVDLGGVEPGDGIGRKDGGQQIGAGLGQFVQDQRTSRNLGEDRKQAGAGRRLQHNVARSDASGGDGGESERRRRGKLLERLALLGAARMRRQETGDFGDGGKPRRRRRGLAEKRLSEFAQEQDGCDFTGVISRLPVPGAGGVGASTSGFHGGAQDCCVNTLAAFQMGKKESGRGKDRGRWGKRRGRTGRGRSHVHGREPRESGNGKARSALSLDRPDSPRPGVPRTLNIASREKRPDQAVGRFSISRSVDRPR